jgi:hypothetical protein
MLGNELAAQVSSSECRDGVRHRCLDLGQRGVIGVDHSSLVLVELGPRHPLELLGLVLGRPLLYLRHGVDNRLEEQHGGHVLAHDVARPHRDLVHAVT